MHRFKIVGLFLLQSLIHESCFSQNPQNILPKNLITAPNIHSQGMQWSNKFTRPADSEVHNYYLNLAYILFIKS